MTRDEGDLPALREVAKSLFMSVGALYHYVDNAADLELRVDAFINARLSAMLSSHSTGDQDLAQLITQMLRVCPGWAARAADRRRPPKTFQLSRAALEIAAGVTPSGQPTAITLVLSWIWEVWRRTPSRPAAIQHMIATVPGLAEVALHATNDLKPWPARESQVHPRQILGALIRDPTSDQRVVNLFRTIGLSNRLPTMRELAAHGGWPVSSSYPTSRARLWDQASDAYSTALLRAIERQVGTDDPVATLRCGHQAMIDGYRDLPLFGVLHGEYPATQPSSVETDAGTAALEQARASGRHTTVSSVDATLMMEGYVRHVGLHHARGDDWYGASLAVLDAVVRQFLQ